MNKELEEAFYERIMAQSNKETLDQERKAKRKITPFKISKAEDYRRQIVGEAYSSVATEVTRYCEKISYLERDLQEAKERNAELEAKIEELTKLTELYE